VNANDLNASTKKLERKIDTAIYIIITNGSMFRSCVAGEHADASSQSFSQARLKMTRESSETVSV